MEPDNLKSTPPDDAALEAWLRTNAALPPLPDDDFSRRVLSALTVPAQLQRRLPTRFIAGLAGALVGAGLALSQLLSGPSLPALKATALATLTQFSQPGIGLALGAVLLSLAYVFWRDLRRIVWL